MRKTAARDSVRLHRRDLLKLAGSAAAAACCGPTIVPSSVLGALAPSNRVNVGMIGMGNQSEVDLPAFLEQADTQLLAVCDVNTGSHGYRAPEQFLGRKPGQDYVNAYYAKKTGASDYKGCDAYNDFREVIGRNDIDAVVLIVPDHWHAIMTVAAAKAGKDIYCEKPFSLTVRDGQEMVKAVREHQRVLQTGSMWRSNPTVRLACELVRNGRIGKVKRVVTEVCENNFKGPGPGWQPMPVPEGFDYDLWLGPAPATPYHALRCFYKFRFIMDYSGGQTTNFGAHSNGIVQWALGMDHSGPVEFEDLASEWPEPGDLFTTPNKVHFRARYADDIELECTTTKRGFGVRFEGTEGWVDFSGAGLKTSPEGLAETKFGPQEVRLPIAVKEFPGGTPKRSQSFDHVRNFLDCMKTREDPVEFAEAGHRTASICHLGNIAMKLRRKFQWDPAQEQVVGDDEAAKMLGRTPREPWTLY